MKKLIFADALKEAITANYSKDIAEMFCRTVDAVPDVSEDVQIVNAAVLNHFVEAAYKAGKDGKPLMVALNEVEHD